MAVVSVSVRLINYPYSSLYIDSSIYPESVWLVGQSDPSGMTLPKERPWQAYHGDEYTNTWHDSVGAVMTVAAVVVVVVVVTVARMTYMWIWRC